MKKAPLQAFLVFAVFSASSSAACEATDYDIKALAGAKIPISAKEVRRLAATSEEFCEIRSGANEMAANLVREKLLYQEDLFGEPKRLGKILTASLGEDRERAYLERLVPPSIDGKMTGTGRLYLSRQEWWVKFVVTAAIGDTNLRGLTR